MHNEDVKFYKYLSSSSTLAVLENSTLKWSNISLFNDPFDFPIDMGFPFSGEEIANLLVLEMADLVYGKEEPIGDITHPLFSGIIEGRKNRLSCSKKEYIEYMREVIPDSAQGFHGASDEFKILLRNFREEFCVLCVSKKFDDLLMWAHYAENHTGCVFKFKCKPELDRPLCAARKVIYKKNHPLISDAKTYVKHLTGQIRLNTDNLYTDFAYTKSDHWSYEEEWRCITNLRDTDKGFDLDPMIPEELEAIYLGCRISTHDKDQILEIVNQKYTKTEIYQGKLSNQKYALKFERLK